MHSGTQPKVVPWQLRAEFARRLSQMYGTEVPAYNALAQAAHRVNTEVATRLGPGAERLGSISRVTAERHGAIRVGTPRELAQVGRIFGAMGMYPVGFYDLRDAAGSSLPVVATAFRPIASIELARNPFRMFASMLVPWDRRFFAAELQGRIESFLERRQLFPAELVALADRCEASGGLPQLEADAFLALAVQSFTLSAEPVDRAWYTELGRVSAVAADIAGVRSTHLNHLTPRVLDIDQLYVRMQAWGIDMIDAIQGPPRWGGPDLLLRQTSFRALAEPRTFREPDGTVVSGSLRVRFGEVEARGIAVTRRGRRVYDELARDLEADIAEAGRAVGRPPTIAERNDFAAKHWRQRLPASEHGLAMADLAFFTYAAAGPPMHGAQPIQELPALVGSGWLVPEPIVYEDFLPRSAAGIFASNLTSDGSKDPSQEGAAIDSEWVAGVLDRVLHDPFDLYAAERDASLVTAASQLGLAAIAVPEQRVPRHAR